MKECRLELHPEKTKVVFCKEQNKQGDYPRCSFDFLGFTFRPRLAKNKYGKFFVCFLPAISTKAVKSIGDEMRTWRIHNRSDKSLEDLSRMLNPQIRGWIKYYAKFSKSSMFTISNVLNRIIARWAMRKFKQFRGRQRRATHWLGRVARRNPDLFAHWQILRMRPAAGQ